MSDRSPIRTVGESRFGFGKKDNPKDLKERRDRYKLEKKVEQQ
jgi:hypothetical protein